MVKEIGINIIICVDRISWIDNKHYNRR